MDITELLSKKKEAVDAATEIRNRVYADQNGEWRGDDNAKFDDLMAKADGFSAEVERAQKLEKAQRSLVDANEPTGRRSQPMQPVSTSLGKATPKDAEMAIRGWLLAGSEEELVSEAHRSAAKRMGINLGSKSMRIKLLGAEAPQCDYIGGDIGYKIQRSGMDAWEKRAALGVGSTTIGGFTVPDAPMGALEKAMLEFGGMRQVATVLRTDSGADLPIPTNDDTSNKGAILAENTQVTETDPTFGQLVLQAYKYSSKSVLVSVEFLQDSSIDAMGFIGNALATRIGRIQNDHFTTGTGSAQPNGIVTAATSSAVTASGQTSCTYDNILDLIHSVDPAYRNNGRFLLHDSALKMIRKVKVLQYSGDSVGAPLWVPGVNGLGDTIIGYPYVINQSLATVATGTKSVLFGDLSKYLIRDCREVTLVRLDERYADYHQVGFLAFARTDGDLLDAGTHPVKYMTQA